jgi:hypothetical protein
MYVVLSIGHVRSTLDTLFATPERNGDVFVFVEGSAPPRGEAWKSIFDGAKSETQ